MVNVLPGHLRGILSLTLYALNTVFWSVLLFIIALAKALVPVKSWRHGCSRILNAIAENWIGINTFSQDLVGHTRWDIQGAERLNPSDWYLVVSNHQSWVDILVLQRIFNRKIPFLKFFIKKELFWFPVLGLAWWALDFPFIQRYPKTKLRKNPHLKGKDLEITRRACEKFKKIPVSIMNFVEGTRFTRKKHRRQHSPYTHLLKPKAGGIAFVLGAMGDQIHRILDVTIVYPGTSSSFWALLCGNIEEIKVSVRSLPIGPELIGDYANDAVFRKQLQQWVNDLWGDKDRCMAEMLGADSA